MIFGIAATAILMLSLDASLAQDTSFGQRLFQDKADCQFCHGIDGDGRGIAVFGDPSDVTRPASTVIS